MTNRVEVDSCLEIGFSEPSLTLQLGMSSLILWVGCLGSVFLLTV